MSTFTGSALWQEAILAPRLLRGLLSRFARPDADLRRAIALLRDARRIVVTGNGAAFYAGRVLESALRLAPADSRAPFAIAIEAGILAAGSFRWREGDLPVIVSTSGELADMVTILPALPSPWVVITAHGDSTLGAAAEARVLIEVASQKAVTHTQAYLSNTLAALLLARALGAPTPDLGALPDLLAHALAATPAVTIALADAVGTRTGGIALAEGAGWSTAFQTALLLKEVAGLAIEGFEAREAATTGMYALTAEDVVVSHALPSSSQASIAEEVCAGVGAVIVRLEAPVGTQPLNLPILGFPAAVALAAEIGLRRGRNIDQPDWTAAYYRTARVSGTA